jgi:phenylalanyl-tRNA synthetase beta chain
VNDVDIVRTSPNGFHPGRTAALIIDGAVVGHVGELAPSVARHYEISGRVAVAEIDLDPLLAVREPGMSATPSTYPFVDFDLSFMMSAEQPVQPVVNATKQAASGLVESARVFDEFREVGEGLKAVAIRYRLRSADRTLTNEDVAPVREAMIDAATELGAKLRGV